MENISDEDYAHVQKVLEVFEIKNRGEYQELYVTLLKWYIIDILKWYIIACRCVWKL